MEENKRGREDGGGGGRGWGGIRGGGREWEGVDRDE